MLADVPILSETTDAVTTLTIERTHRRNALDLPTLEELDAAVTTAVEDGARAHVLTGAAGHFCAGADLTELEDVSFTERLAEVLVHLSGVPITTVAAISGSCMGLGMQLALACDLRVVEDGARFAVPVAKLGLMVDKWTLERAARFWGEGAARHMVLTAGVLDHEDAWRLGFAQQEFLEPEVMRLLEQSAIVIILRLVGPDDAIPAHGRLTVEFGTEVYRISQHTSGFWCSVPIGIIVNETGIVLTAVALSGLALSGGGIRSATFNLGVLQALNRAGLLDRFDYLSTVSGGGYVGGYTADATHAKKLLVNLGPFSILDKRGMRKATEDGLKRTGRGPLRGESRQGQVSEATRGVSPVTVSLASDVLARKS